MLRTIFSAAFRFTTSIAGQEAHVLNEHIIKCLLWLSYAPHVTDMDAGAQQEGKRGKRYGDCRTVIQPFGLLWIQFEVTARTNEYSKHCGARWWCCCCASAYRCLSPLPLPLPLLPSPSLALCSLLACLFVRAWTCWKSHNVSFNNQVQWRHNVQQGRAGQARLGLGRRESGRGLGRAEKSNNIAIRHKFLGEYESIYDVYDGHWHNQNRHTQTRTHRP